MRGWPKLRPASGGQRAGRRRLGSFRGRTRCSRAPRARTSRSPRSFSARRTREHLLAIYGYARLVDQIGDASPGDRPAQLDTLERALDRIFDGRRCARASRASAPRALDRRARRFPGGRSSGCSRRTGATRPRPNTRPSPSSSATATCRRTRSASSSCTSSAPRHPSGSRSRTRSARRSSSPSTGRTSPRITRPGASTCRREDRDRFGVTRAELEEKHAGPALKRADGVRGRHAAAALLDEGAPLVVAPARARPARRRRLRRRRAGGVRGDRARRPRRARRAARRRPGPSGPAPPSPPTGARR